MASSTPRRPGFTLFEMVLVVALIAILAALTYPSLNGMYGYYRLTAATDQLRAAWATGRARAVEESRPYRFTPTMGQSTYRLAPDGVGGPAGSGSSGSPGSVLMGSLPGGVVFNAAPAGSGGMGGTSGLPNIVFQPDGTASEDVAITLRVPGALPALVRLRALTGTVSVQVGKGHL